MDWKKIVMDLMRSGVSQTEIGRKVGLSQPGVSDIARGKTKEVGWGAGDALIRLHRARCGGARKKATPAA